MDSPLFWSLILLAVGLCVIVLELFVPSAGMLGLVAAILIVTGVVFAFLESLQVGAIVLLLTVLAIPILLILMVKIWPSTPIGRRILLDDLDADDVLPKSTVASDLVGQLGIAKTKMLPSGIVLIDGQKLDAVSDGFAIEPGQPVKVIAIQGNRIHVEPYDGNLEDAADMPVRDRDILSQPIEELGLDDFDENS